MMNVTLNLLLMIFPPMSAADEAVVACVHFESHQYDHRIRRGGVCVGDGYEFGFYGVRGRAAPSFPTTAFDPGGQLSCDVGPYARLLVPVAPSGPLSTISLWCRAACHTCTPAQIKSLWSNFKSVSAGLFLGGNKTNLFP